MLCVSVSYAQSAADQERNRDAAGIVNQNDPAGLAGRNPYAYAPTYPASATGPMYVACWAEVPSHNTAYFSATFVAPAIYSARKEFSELVTAQYGAVNQVQCAGKFSEAVVKDKVQRWKDKASAANNAIVETDWAASTATAVVPLNGPDALTAGQ
jgi:hypothetical protein